MSYCRSYFCCFSCFTTALDPKSCCFCFYFFFLKFYRTQTLEQPVLKSTIAGMDIIHQPKCLMLLEKPHNLSLLLGLGLKSFVSLDEGRGHRRCCERSAARSPIILQFSELQPLLNLLFSFICCLSFSIIAK